jgi:hypothetical protein
MGMELCRVSKLSTKMHVLASGCEKWSKGTRWWNLSHPEDFQNEIQHLEHDVDNED